jgi:hypothetical protein
MGVGLMYLPMDIFAMKIIMIKAVQFSSCLIFTPLSQCLFLKNYLFAKIKKAKKRQKKLPVKWAQFRLAYMRVVEKKIFSNS